MRIVDNLKETTICPNCGSDTLLRVQHPADMTQSKFCPNCREEIFEEGSSFILDGAVVTSQQIKEKEEQEQLLFDARDLLHDLPLFARTSNELDTLTHITNIFDKILTLLERKEQ
jgi:predicted RNA-binding Zn-ribbon protein involved in translation (DUF1610 family)